MLRSAPRVRTAAPAILLAAALLGFAAPVKAQLPPQSQAAAQASRCSQCGVPFCQAHCPLANNIPDWLRLTAELNRRIYRVHDYDARVAAAALAAHDEAVRLAAQLAAEAAALADQTQTQSPLDENDQR